MLPSLTMTMSSPSIPLCYLLLLMMLVGIQQGAAVHPHPNVTDSVRDYHRQMRQTYPTTYINSGLCSDVSYNECLQMEEDMRENARTLQDIYLTHGFVRVLVVLVKFEDHKNRQLPKAKEYRELFNGEGTSDIIPTGSVRQWIDANSYGALDIEAEVVDWTVSDDTEFYYSFGKSGISVEFRKSMYPALDRLESEGFDFSRFDLNDDGLIDNIVLLHSGYAAEIGGVDCDTGAKHEERIWSHAIGSRDDNWVSKSSGIRASGYSVSSGLRGHCHSRVARIGVITHEVMHTLGLPDINDNSGEYIGRGVGEFDVMSNAHGRDGAQIHPAFLCPWSKIQLGWLDPIEIEEDGLIEIEASELAGQVYIIRKNFPEGEYLLIENRQPVMWDELLWGGGLLIWHMDDTQTLLKNRGYPGQDGWPGNGVHYAIAICGADGDYDLERGNNGGDNSEFWRDGASLKPGLVEKESSNKGTYPNTNSYQDGRIKQTGVVIDQTSSSNTVMSFRVLFLTGDPTSNPSSDPTSSPTREPTREPTAEPTLPPTTMEPTPFPTILTLPPSPQPTPEPTTQEPTPAPIPKQTALPTFSPTPEPTQQPTQSTPLPTVAPTPRPTPQFVLFPVFTVQPTSLLGEGSMQSGRTPSPMTEAGFNSPPSSVNPTANPTIDQRTKTLFLDQRPSIGSVMRTMPPDSASTLCCRTTTALCTTALLLCSFMFTL